MDMHALVSRHLPLADSCTGWARTQGPRVCGLKPELFTSRRWMTVLCVRSHTAWVGSFPRSERQQLGDPRQVTKALWAAVDRALPTH